MRMHVISWIVVSVFVLAVPAAQAQQAPGQTVQLPTFSMFTTSTTVSVPDGGTLLIGGLKRAGERDREQGVPVLSKIALIAPLVTNRAKTRDDEALLILIKPKIIIQKETEEDIDP